MEFTSILYSKQFDHEDHSLPLRGTLNGMLTAVAEQDETQDDVAKNDENHDKPRLNVSMYLSRVSGHFYGRMVTPL